LRKAFSIQMGDFDWRLEGTLKQMLDPVVVGPVPVRRRQSQTRPPFGLPSIMFGPRPLLTRLNTQAMEIALGEESLMVPSKPG
jgi:hypothetical protein